MEDSLRSEMMKKMQLGLMLLMTAGAASAEWTRLGGEQHGGFIQYVDRVLTPAQN